jgi:hypothetical protein
MTENSRILEIRLGTLERMQIGPANPYPPDFDDRLTRPRDRRIHFPIPEFSGFYTN